jgi:predicted DNA-binding protein (UPF0251 family)
VAVDAASFASWADRVGLTLDKQREALRLILVDGLSINAASRAVDLAPSTVSRAKARYRFPLCPCCGQALPGFAVEDDASRPR